jgi:hypothetical protein
MTNLPRVCVWEYRTRRLQSEFFSLPVAETFRDSDQIIGRDSMRPSSVKIHLNARSVEWAFENCGSENSGFFDSDVTIRVLLLERSGHEFRASATIRWALLWLQWRLTLNCRGCLANGMRLMLTGPVYPSTARPSTNKNYATQAEEITNLVSKQSRS